MRTAKSTIAVLGYECGIGAGNQDCARGPMVLKNSPYLADIQDKLTWLPFLKTDGSSGLEALTPISKLANELATQVASLIAQDQFFLIIGGDHSSAIGAWSGVATAISPLSLGLLWIDAHTDSHTMSTTPSGNIHGMPLASLLGHGDPLLTTVLSPKPKLLPENVSILGVRSFETEEHALLQKLQVKIFYAEEIKQKGFETILTEAVNHITQNSQFFGISIDLDAFDPIEAPGVGTPEPNGIQVADFLAFFRHIVADPRFIGAEIVEFNPNKDKEHKTEAIAAKIIKDLVTGLK